MKYFGTAPYIADPRLRQSQRITDRLLIHRIGSAKKPASPQGGLSQSGSRGFIVSWTPGPGMKADIAGWRIFSPTEATLYKEIGDPSTNSCFIESSADNGSGSAETIAAYVCSINAQGVESPKIEVFGKATYEAGAPAVPSVPPSYTGGGGSGVCFSGNTLLRGGRSIEEIKTGDQVFVRTADGSYALRFVRKVDEHDYDGPLLDMGGLELVTREHPFLSNGQWVAAETLFGVSVPYKGKVFNLHIDTQDDAERNYILRNGRIVHNAKNIGLE